MTPLARLVRSRRSAWLTVIAAALAIGALFAFLPQGSDSGFPASGLPDSAESARVAALLDQFPSADTTAGIVLWERPDGLTGEDREAIAQRATALAARSTTPQAVHPQFSDDGRAALVAVPLSRSEVEADVQTAASELRSTASADLPAGLSSYLTGAVGFQADISNAFAGADLRLLLVTVLVVAVLLIATYRSPVLWIVPLVVVGAADGLARVVATALADAAGITVDASVSGILSVLVFGAGTNYALLLVARYREELLHEPDRHRAMTTAVRSAGPAIAASGGTVALSLLTLLLAELAGNRALGFACAIGVAIAIAFALAVLPSALVLCGRGLFWPFIPRPDADGHLHREGRPGPWTRLGRGVARHPARIAVIATLGVGLLSLGLVGARVGLSQTDQLLGDPESVRAQLVIDDSFGAGLTAQTTVLAPDDAVGEATTLAEATPGVAAVRPGESANGRTALDVTLASEPESTASFATITALRKAYSDAEGPAQASLVGGSDATALDTRTASEHDQALIIPIILGIVFLILTLLLRSLVAPVLLIASVLATFFASLGAATVLFRTVLGFPAFDANVVLFAFLFLVALGVDYNIFLVTRAKEERARHGTREGMVRALASTGGVITSAGILLAAVFAVLGVLPVVALTQIGVIVCVGVLLDTLVVRTVLVPALVFLTGDAFWRPGVRRPIG
ncbi:MULTISPECIES: MMPL family transporter [unclassified Rathayibacter]|uniref:MMPL family transporter n=1 Tax=unclassified Rathayibacter TaxID=2609250 RepID=UPI00188C3EEA|nr:MULTISPECIES: MMPL family transporter [unclassified Rathayibacter]MBF4460923.1 MMPL family transporter [Rathayibacter sp. VKM Ac-2879]MBF4502334.1 MMPL family transporter [Rathayibacter sp. VKM Ac-2878]